METVVTAIIVFIIAAIAAIITIRNLINKKRCGGGCAGCMYASTCQKKERQGQGKA